MPTFSIIMPNYKTEAYLEESLLSLLNQTYTDFEILVINDGSPGSPLDKEAWNRTTYNYKHKPSEDILLTDQCEWIIKQIGDDRIRYIHKENAGQGFARNTGIDKATGKYIVLFDCDDILPENYLEIAADSLAQKPKDTLYFAGMRMLESSTRRIYPYSEHVLAAPWPNTLKTILLFPNWTTNLVCYFWPKEYLDKHNIRFTLTMDSEDLDFRLEALKHWTGSMNFTPIPTYQLYRIHSEQNSLHHEKALMKNYIMLGKRHKEWISKHGWREWLLVRLFIFRSTCYHSKLNSKGIKHLMLNALTKPATAISLLLSGGRLLKKGEDPFDG